ncbi:hypothetical protein AB1Y20_020918 [Prymnesium parvum]|uniref:Uncharacterized protein n=1 Tax=Prymnesium parvum TaxID=97485 RepID=A0AB34JIX5_PRYPA
MLRREESELVDEGPLDAVRLGEPHAYHLRRRCGEEEEEEEECIGEPRLPPRRGEEEGFPLASPTLRRGRVSAPSPPPTCRVLFSHASPSRLASALPT